MTLAQTLALILAGTSAGAFVQDQPADSSSAIRQVGSLDTAPPDQHDDTNQDARTGADQIGSTSTGNADSRVPSGVYLSDEVQVNRPGSTASVVDASRDQASQPDGSNATPQLTSAAESERAIAQLSQMDVDATLAQLSSAEREVLLQAIAGTDICDNPPEIEAVRELCETRIETRSREFGARAANTLSPEERLLGEGLDRRHSSNLADGVERAARNAGRGDADRLDTQAIASVALGTPQPPPTQPDGTDTSDLPAETQALVNAIVQQLGGGGPQ